MHKIKSLEELNNIAKDIAKISTIGDVITLEGDLGVGKTAFAKFFINAALEKNEEVISPTFNIVQTYSNQKLEIWHYDLYRLKSNEELLELALDDALSNGITLIEWPDFAKDYLPEDKLSILFEHGDSDNKRIITIKGKGKWQNLQIKK